MKIKRFGEIIGLYFWRFKEKLNYFQEVGEQRQNTFKELRKLFSWISSLRRNALFLGSKGAETPRGDSCQKFGTAIWKTLETKYQQFLDL